MKQRRRTCDRCGRALRPLEEDDDCVLSGERWRVKIARRDPDGPARYRSVDLCDDCKARIVTDIMEGRI